MQVQINPDIFIFFSSLKTNNNREWFDAQKPRFKALEKEFKEIGVALQSKLNETDSIDQLKLFRIYRDVRFSNDKTPFKTHFGMSFSRQKPALRGGYYIHIQPGGSFIATGFWDPSKEDLLRIRKELETDADELRTLMAAENFKKAWGNLEGEEVKTAPKGFSKEGANIDLVRKTILIYSKLH